MIRGVGRFIAGLFNFLLRLLDVLRRTVLNLLFLLIVGVIVVLWWRPDPTLPEDTVLVLRPSGTLVEQGRIEEPLDFLHPGRAVGAQTALYPMLEAIRTARDDDRVRALVIETDELNQAGISKLAELRAAIEEFRASGKPVVARGERFSQAQYYLASAADEVYLAPDGFVLLRGLARYVSYFGDALESLGVKVHVFRVGEYKTFSEPFTRNNMSEADRQNSRDLLTGVWNTFREDVATSRDIDMGALDRYIQDYSEALASVGGDPAQAALAAGLVDALVTRDEWRHMLSTRFGMSHNDYNQARALSPERYLALHTTTPEADGRVAVLVAQGAIVDGDGGPGGVAGDRLAQRIREAREDATIDALVLRIDSPGGSAWASEVIRRELELTRAAGMPVIASLSSTAASGGYWIAAGADEIWAHPLSLTGSIGIFALVPEISDTLGRMGITSDGVSTGPLAGAFDPRRPMEPLAAEALQSGIEHGYRRFLQIVAEARDLSVPEVELAARGQVWTGAAAGKIGLVDHMGGVLDAIDAAAARAGVTHAEVVWPQPRMSAGVLVMRRLGEWVGVGESAPVPSGGTLGEAVFALKRDAEALMAWDDPHHQYVHCLCEGP